MRASILINNYNYQEFIDECVSSVVNQSYKDIEIIFFDDASTDNSLEKLKKYFPQLIIISNSEAKAKNNSHNQFNAIKKAFEKSTGDVIFLLDSDDYFFKTKVEKIVNLYRLNSKVKSIQDSITTLKNNQTIKLERYFTVDEKFDALDFVKRLNLIINLGPQTSGMSFRRDYFLELINKYDFTVPLIWPDIQLGRRALFERRALIINESYTVRRIHDLSDSLKLKNKKIMSDFLVQYSKWFNNGFKAKIDLNYNNKNKSFIKLKILFYFIKSLNFKAIHFLYLTSKG
jgi:glycosyltransferase involved in cell wall biosynthesis